MLSPTSRSKGRAARWRLWGFVFIKVRRLRFAFVSGAPLTVTLAIQTGESCFMSETETQREYLHRQIHDRLMQLESSVQWYRWRHYRYQSGAVVLSALITVVSGLKLTLLPDFAASNIALVLGALSTVVAAFGAFFSPQQSWHLNAEIYGRLRALEAQLDFAEREHDFEKSESVIVAKMFDEYQAILADYNRKWQELRQKSK